MAQEILSTKAAASYKGCSDVTIRTEIRKGRLDGGKVGSCSYVIPNRKYTEWEPDPKFQAQGRAAVLHRRDKRT